MCHLKPDTTVITRRRNHISNLIVAAVEEVVRPAKAIENEEEEHMNMFAWSDKEKDHEDGE